MPYPLRYRTEECGAAEIVYNLLFPEEARSRTAMTRAVPFTAAAAATGYLYQCRYALRALLERAKNDPDSALSIERYDDIAFETGGTPQELVQTKHHLGGAPDLTDGSADLWKTIRVWAEGVAAGRYPIQAAFVILTTATASAGGAAECLRPGPQRNVARALELLESACAAGTGEGLAAARAAFQALNRDQRQQLVGAIQVLDRAPTINASAEEIRQELGYPVAANRIAAFQERLEGWWFGQVILRLTGAVDRPITGVDLSRAMDDLRDSFRQDSLPIDFLHDQPQDVPHPDEDERTFVKQLHLIQVSPDSMRWAQVDYYRAYAQRSRWLKDGLVVHDHLAWFDSVLTEDWERLRARTQDSGAAGAIEPIAEGQALYRHLQDNCRAIRPNCTEPFVGRGSYQMLADQLRVGWHRDFRAMLRPPAGASA